MPKRPEYQYCKDKKLYRKQIKNAEGKYISLYGKTPSELTSRIKEFQFELKCQKKIAPICSFPIMLRCGLI